MIATHQALHSANILLVPQKCNIFFALLTCAASPKEQEKTSKKFKDLKLKWSIFARKKEGLGRFYGQRLFPK